MSDYIDRLEAIEREEEQFNRLEYLLTKRALPLTELGFIEPKKVAPIMFKTTGEEKLFGFDLVHPKEGPVKGYAWEGFFDGVIIFFFVYRDEKATVACTTTQKGKKTEFSFYNEASHGRYADLFTYIDIQFLKRSMGTVWNRITEVLAEEQ